MSDSSGGGTRWLKYGCFGCLGLFAFVVLLVGGVTGVAWLTAEDPQVEDRVLTQDVPRGGGSIEDAASHASPTGAGTVTLDLWHAEFELLPGEPGEPLRVEANYDTNAYEVEETFDQPEGQDWHYAFRFRRKGAGWFSMLREMFSNSAPEVRIFLPPDAPIRLDLDLHQGGAEVDLGGLWLTEADIQAGQSGLLVRVPEPLHEPMRRLNVDVQMAGALIEGIGNASPAELVVEMSMGGLKLDLRGAWKNDAEITVVTQRAGGELRLPSDVRVEGTGMDRFPSIVEPEVPLPTLRFTSRSNLKDLDVKR